MRLHTRIWWVLCALLTLGAAAMYGQLISGVIVGTITDSSGAGVAEALVTVTSMDTGVELRTHTSISGTYSVVSLQPGRYQLAIEKAGFQTVRATGIQLAAQQTVRQDFQLTVGAIAQQIEVQGSASLVRTDTTSIGGSINSRQVADLPQAMQSIDTLIRLTPGAQTTVSEQPRTSGARYWGGSYFTLNGVSEYDAAVGRGATSILGLENQPPISSLQEFKVESVNANAEYRAVNTIMLVTKAGTNQFHGQAYEYVQNTALNANDFLLNATGRTRPPLNWNQFGANLGGPVLRNKAFFFANYSGFRRRVSQTVQFRFPSMAMRQGDFSALCAAYNANGVCMSPGGTQLHNPFNGQPFPNNRIPSSLITSQARTLLNYLPAPTDLASPALPDGTPNYVGVVPLGYDRNALDMRFDYQIRGSDSVYAVYSRNTSPLANTYIGYPASYGNGQNFADQTYNYSLAETHIFGPRTVNELRLGYFNMLSLRYGQNADFDPRSLFPQLMGSRNHGLPTMNIPGYTGMFSDFGSFSRHANAPTINLTESLTRIRGRHIIKAGADISRYRYWDGATGIAPLGSFSFDGRWTAGRGWPGTPTSPGNAFADFLLGAASSSSSGLRYTRDVLSAWLTEFYVQDSWQIKPRLTLYYGLRYMYQTPWAFRDNMRTTFDLGNSKLVLAQDSAMPVLPAYGAQAALFAAYPYETTQSIGLPRQYIRPDKNNVGPRVGFAYRLSGSQASSMVLRAGYGVFYNINPSNVTGGIDFQNPPWFGGGQNYSSRLTGSPPSPFLPDITFQNPFPAELSASGVSAHPALNMMQHDFKNAVTQQWNVTLEREFAGQWLVRASYVGSQTHHVLWYQSDINVPVAQQPSTPIQDQRPWQPWSNVFTVRSGGKQNLNQLQLEMTKRLTRGFMAQVQYQWTRSLDNAPVTGGPQIWQYPALDYGNTQGVLRHALVFNYIYELPFGKGRQWLSDLSGPLAEIAGGWQVAGITSFLGGQPFSVGFNVPARYVGWWGGRADLVSGASLYEGKQSGSHNVVSGVRWFNPAAFTAPQPGAWGNSARNLLWTPGSTNWDISLFKSFAIPRLETHHLQLRADFFDAFNHFNLGAPGATVGSPQYGGSPVTTTGMIYSGTGKRIVQVGMRYQF